MRMTFKQTVGSAAAVAVLASGALLLSVADTLAQRSPVGAAWDCLIDGAQGVGVAYMTFHDDFSFTGVSVIRPNRIVKTPVDDDSDDMRTNGDDTGRGGETSSSTPTVAYSSQNIYGYGAIDGRWNYDEAGRVVGYFVQLIDFESADSVTTNMIGFRAIVVPERRMTLTAYVPGGGRSVFRGIPMREMPDMTGSWYGLQKTKTAKLYEFFDVAPTEQYGAYTVSGSGAAYDTEGYMILSSRGRIGMAILCGDKLRATVGTYSRRSRIAATTGILEPGDAVRFNAYHYPEVVVPLAPEP